MDLNLLDKNALVCGSTQGIGKATAIELASLGATITLLGRDETKLRSTLLELSSSQGQKHNFVKADFTFPEQVKEVVDQLITVKDIHILINNTGGPPAGKAIDASAEDF